MRDRIIALDVASSNRERADAQRANWCERASSVVLDPSRLVVVLCVAGAVAAVLLLTASVIQAQHEAQTADPARCKAFVDSEIQTSLQAYDRYIAESLVLRNWHQDIGAVMHNTSALYAEWEGLYAKTQIAREQLQEVDVFGDPLLHPNTSVLGFERVHMQQQQLPAADLVPNRFVLPASNVSAFKLDTGELTSAIRAAHAKCYAFYTIPYNVVLASFVSLFGTLVSSLLMDKAPWLYAELSEPTQHASEHSCDDLTRKALATRRRRFYTFLNRYYQVRYLLLNALVHLAFLTIFVFVPTYALGTDPFGTYNFNYPFYSVTKSFGEAIELVHYV